MAVWADVAVLADHGPLEERDCGPPKKEREAVTIVARG